MAVIAVISAIGLLVLLSASSYYSLTTYGNESYLFFKQLIFIIAGFIVMLIASHIDYKIYYPLGKYVYGLGIILSIAVMAFGQIRRGSNRWISIGSINIQPSEILKLGVILFLSTYLVKAYKHLDVKKIRRKFFLIGFAPVILIVRSNLSTAVIILLITLNMYFLASKNIKVFIIITVFAIVGYIFAYPLAIFADKVGILRTYQAERIYVWKHPEEYQEKAYQTLQGLYAIGRGGLFGKGIGQSLQKLILPEAQNDMIFAILCEELGLFGAGILFVLYIVAIYRMYTISANAKDIFGMFLAFGIMIHFALQIILNIGVVCNLLPNTGVTLPFVSYGGSSTLILSLEIGIALSVSKFSYDKNSR